MTHEQDPEHVPAPELPDDFHLPSRRRLLEATGITAGVALVVLLLFILPAEYGIDPTGFGDAVGIDGIAEAAGAPASPAAVEEDQVFSSATVVVELAPGQGLERKFTMDAGNTIVYSWITDGPVYFDFHGDPAGTDGSEFVSYQTGTNQQEDGSFRADFGGKHGWYWKNSGSLPVTVTLEIAGHYT